MVKEFGRGKFTVYVLKALKNVRVNFSRTKPKASFSSLHLMYKLTLNYFSFFFFFDSIYRLRD